MDKDIGILVVLMERLEKQRLPRILLLKEKVYSGLSLNRLELDYLEKLLTDAKKILPLINRHPEYQDLEAKIIELYVDIVEKDLQLEKAEN